MRHDHFLRNQAPTPSEPPLRPWWRDGVWIAIGLGIGATVYVLVCAAVPGLFP